MNSLRPIIYMNPDGTPLEIPLARFLPTDPPGMAHGWLTHNVPPSELLLDPLGASPLMALETACAGYRICVACNNPVLAFELRMLASAPDRNEFVPALAELASQKKGEDRLENVIKGLYQTSCASCGALIQATYFLWRHDEPLPYARVYHCPTCGDSGEHLITDEDAQQVQMLDRTDRLHRSRAIERVLDSGTEDRALIEEALTFYPPRALYVLFTLLNKIEGMSLPPRRRELLEALMVSVMDAGNTIWSWPQERERPRQLSTPPQYIEKNLWMELEHAVETWSVWTRKTRLSEWPDLPQDAGICLYPGRVRDLVQEAQKPKFEEILTVFPRPNQAFWTLCSLWSSWLWGRDKASRFTSVMERRRFDWHWHTTALHSALSSTVALVEENVRVFGILPEPAPGLVSSVVEAAAVSGMNLSGFATKNDIEPVQMEWKTGSTNREFIPVNIQKIAREAIRDLLNEIGEPTEYIELHTAVMCALAMNKAFPPSIQHLTREKAAEIQATLNTLLADALFLRRMGATAQDPESGLWWLAQIESTQTPLADRLELEILEMLQKQKEIPEGELVRDIYQRFPGYLTPPDALIQQCLESYAIHDRPRRTWKIYENEIRAAREKDTREIQELLVTIAKKLALHYREDYPILWQRESKTETLLYQLVVSTKAVIDRSVLAGKPEGCETIFLLPGSRSGLLQYKLSRDPYLAEQISEHCHFLKFRTLRSIAGRKELSLELWKVLIESDPISLEETTQLSMFG